MGGNKAIYSEKEMSEGDYFGAGLAFILTGLFAVWMGWGGIEAGAWIAGFIFVLVGLGMIIGGLITIYSAFFDSETIIIPQETINEIDWMSGYRFEKYVQDLYRAHGYSVTHTQLSGDQGADLILSTKDGDKIAVQTKRHSQRISNKAVQEVVASKALYGCNRCMVVTNNYYTQSAIELANANNVELVDRDGLMRLIHDIPSDPSEVENVKKEVVPLTSNDYQSLNSKGVYQAKLGNYQKGIEYYDQALKITEDDPIIWKNKGAALAQLGKYEDAIICYDKAIQIDPTIDNLWHVKGKALQALGNHEEAIECFDKELSLYLERENIK